jgi:hypothetical protein
MVIGKIKNITSLFFLLVFLLPSLIRPDHSRIHSFNILKDEKHSQTFKINCVICNLEFSNFISDVQNIDLQNESLTDRYCNNYSSLDYSNSSKFSFSLRAPPLKQI